MSYTPRIQTALHEAAHAVTALALGVEFKHVEIDLTGGGHLRFAKDPRAHTLTGHRLCAVVAAAGMAAESGYIGREVVPAGLDAEIIEEYLERAARPRSDAWRISAEAAALVRMHWNAIDKVARRLEVCDRLSADQVREAVRDSRIGRHRSVRSYRHWALAFSGEIVC